MTDPSPGAGTSAGPAYDHLRYVLDGPVAWLVLDRPGHGNALDAQLKSDLVHALRRAGSEARAAVLTGAGDAFCAGHALGDAGRIADLDLGRAQREETRPLLDALADSPIPTLAAVNGIAAGAGLALALSTDLAVAGEAASFASVSTGMGMIPDAGLSFWLPRLLGPARARGLAMLGEAISARRAAEWGLIWEVAPDADLTSRVQTLALALAERGPLALRLTRQALREGMETPWSAQLEREADLQAEAGRSRDFLIGALAAAKGEPPRFEGR